MTLVPVKVSAAAPVVQWCLEKLEAIKVDGNRSQQAKALEAIKYINSRLPDKEVDMFELLCRWPAGLEQPPEMRQV